MYKLLIVDDEMWSRRLIKEVIDWKSLNFSIIHEAETGKEALACLKKEPHDLMIMDMKMPIMDGIELIENMDPSMKTKIIVMSGYDDFNYLRQALKGNAIDYLLKPIIKTDLENAVNKALSLIKKEDVSSHLFQLVSELESNKSFIQYLSLRMQLYTAIVDEDEILTLKVLDEIKKRIEKESESQSLEAYILMDLNYLKDEFIRTHLTPSQSEAFHTLEDIKEPLEQLEAQIKLLVKLMKHRETKGKMYIERVIHYVDTHYTQNITLDNLAKTFFVSKEHLSRLFKKHTSQTLTDYINEKRITYAKQLLGSRKLSPKIACAMSGFTYIHYFYKIFKKYTDLTPSQYASQQNINIV